MRSGRVPHRAGMIRNRFDLAAGNLRNGPTMIGPGMIGLSIIGRFRLRPAKRSSPNLTSLVELISCGYGCWIAMAAAQAGKPGPQAPPGQWAARVPADERSRARAAIG